MASCTCSLVRLSFFHCCCRSSLVLTLALGAIPIIFGEHRHWKQVPSELPFLAILLGAVSGAGINVYNQLIYNKKAGGKIAPELRLPPMMFGSFLFSCGKWLFHPLVQIEVLTLLPQVYSSLDGPPIQGMF